MSACLPHKHEDLSLHLQNPREKLGVAVPAFDQCWRPPPSFKCSLRDKAGHMVSLACTSPPPFTFTYFDISHNFKL